MRRKAIRVAVAGSVFASVMGAACAQTPAAAKSETAPASRRYSQKELAQRPYSGGLPTPAYPSTARVQKQFTVQYVYNYAESTYAPPVTLPIVAAAAAKRDTPEAAITALYSALRTNDYEAWLQCWDEPSRKAFVETTKQQKNGAEYWRSMWRAAFTGKRFVLLDRIETANYIVLDTRIEDASKPTGHDVDSEVLVSQNGQWYLTNAFTTDGLVMNYEAGKNKAVKEYDIAPRVQLTGPAALTAEAQKEFFAKHTATTSVTRTME